MIRNNNYSMLQLIQFHYKSRTYKNKINLIKENNMKSRKRTLRKRKSKKGGMSKSSFGIMGLNFSVETDGYVYDSKTNQMKNRTCYKLMGFPLYCGLTDN